MHKVLVNLFQACPGKNVARLTDSLDMTLAVDWDVKPQTKQTNKYDDFMELFWDLVGLLNF